MAKKANDVKPQAPAPSAEPTPASAVATADANPAAPAADLQAPSAPVQRPLLDVVRESLAKKAEAQAAETEAPTPEAPEADTLEATAEEPTPEQTTDVPAAETDSDEDSKGPVPYERFAEVNNQRKQVEQQLAEFKPVLDAYEGIRTFCDAQGLTPTDFEEALHLAAALKNDPETALRFLEPRYQQLQAATGSTLPPDLAKAVADGDISPEMAARLAKAEGQRQLVAQRAERTQKQTQEQLVRQQMASVQGAVQSWMKSVQTKDPDFKPKTAGAANGPYELFLALFEQSARNAGVKGPDDYVRVADQAYAEVRRSLKSFAPKVTSTAHPRSSTSSVTTSTQQPKSVQEAVALRLKARGISMPVNGTH